MARATTPVCVALIDIDRFKSINDRFGHAVGDAVLREFAAVVGATRRSDDLLAGHGGEEFLILLPATPPAEAETASRALTESVEHHDWTSSMPTSQSRSPAASPRLARAKAPIGSCSAPTRHSTRRSGPDATAFSSLRKPVL